MHELRRGLASHPAVSELVHSMQRPLPPRDDGIKPTTLFPTKRDVEKLNQQELEQLDRATERTYLAKDWIEPDNETRLGLGFGLGLGLGSNPTPNPNPTLSLTLTSPPPTPNPNISPHEQRAFGEKVAAVETLKLRLGAQVMLIKNEIVQLANPFPTPTPTPNPNS